MAVATAATVETGSCTGANSTTYTSPRRVVPEIRRNSHRQACLPDAARADERDEPVLRNVADDAGDVGLAADERGDLGRQSTRARAGDLCARAEQRRIRFQDPGLKLTDRRRRVQAQLVAEKGAEGSDSA